MSRREKEEHRGIKDCDNKSMEIQRKYDNHQWEVSVKQEWRGKQTDENGGGDNYHGQERKKKDHWHEKTQVYLICWNFGQEGRKNWSTSEQCTAMIYELITALQPTSNCFVCLLISALSVVFVFGFVLSVFVFVFSCCWVLVLFQAQVCGTLHRSAVTHPKNPT